MRLDRVRIQCFRNLHAVDIAIPEGLSWVVGPNAAGKTALLEAIYCLGRGRSFRGRRFGSPIEQGFSRSHVQGWVRHPLGPTRLDWSSNADERAQRQRADVALPVRLICEWTHALVDGEPSLRRRFIDWNLARWDRSAVAVFSRYRRLAAQRNAWLRSGAAGPPVWDRAYAEALAALLALRARFFAALVDAFRRVSAEAEWLTELEPHWEGLVAEPSDLLARLERMRAADRERGFTYLGASRADFSVRRQGEPWVASRGQGKVAGIMLQLAAEASVSAAEGHAAIWLVDDLDAELSPEWSARAMALLRRQPGQILVTALTGKRILEASRTAEDAVFHVEHGTVERIAR
ncbi:MAG: DNA replication/repair protein RecF [Halochromatium sp.]